MEALHEVETVFRPGLVTVARSRIASRKRSAMERLQDFCPLERFFNCFGVQDKHVDSS